MKKTLLRALRIVVSVGLLALATVTLGLQDLYLHWAAPDAAAHDALIASKAAWTG